jgi:hypothetical protein
MIFKPEQLGDLLESYKRESDSLREQIAEICYFMNGGLEYNSAWGMSFDDREIAIRIINKRLKEQNPGGKEYM